MIKVLNAVLAIVAGVGGALLLYWLLNKFAERLPGTGRTASSRGCSSGRPCW